MTRDEKVATASRLRSQGLKLREIGEQMGVSLKTVHDWLSDPDRSRRLARLQRYSSPCVECGSPTDGSGGFAAPRSRCHECWHAYQHETRHWTREQIIKWIKAFADANGYPPPATVQATRSDAPSTNATAREFGEGCWKAALRAAGFEPYRDSPRSGHKLGLNHPDIRERFELRAAGVPVAEIARHQGVTPTAVSLSLKRWAEVAA